MSLNQLFEQFVGTPKDASGQSQGGLSDLTNKIPGGLMGGLAAGGVLGVLVGSKKMRKSAGKMAGGAVGLGGAAVLGAVALNAYKNWQDGKSTSSNEQLVPENNFDPIGQVTNDGQPFQVTLIKAMIAAANADGHIDGTEQSAVFDAVNKMQLEASDKALVFDTLQNPPSISEIASQANGVEQASEIYLVSRMAIDPDHPSERAYLEDLAAMMSLPQELVLHLENQMQHQEMQAV